MVLLTTTMKTSASQGLVDCFFVVKLLLGDKLAPQAESAYFCQISYSEVYSGDFGHLLFGVDCGVGVFKHEESGNIQNVKVFFFLQTGTSFRGTCTRACISS